MFLEARYWMKRCREQGEEERGLARSRGRKEGTEMGHVCRGKTQYLKEKRQPPTQRQQNFPLSKLTLSILSAQSTARSAVPLKAAL